MMFWVVTGCDSLAVTGYVVVVCNRTHWHGLQLDNLPYAITGLYFILFLDASADGEHEYKPVSADGMGWTSDLWTHTVNKPVAMINFWDIGTTFRH